jgi:hypothetical protein
MGLASFLETPHEKNDCPFGFWGTQNPIGFDILVYASCVDSCRKIKYYILKKSFTVAIVFIVP